MLHVFDVSRLGNHTYRLQSLSKSFLQTLSEGITIYEKYKELYYDGELTPKSEWKKRIEACKEHSRSTAFKEIASVKKAMRQEEQAVMNAQRRLQLKNALTSSFFNQAINHAQSPFEEAQIKESARQWKQHGNFSHLGDKTLLEMHRLLSSLQQHYSFALEELTARQNGKQWYLLKFKLSKEFYENYQHFLLQQLHVIKQQQNQIAQSALQRLKISDQKSNLSDNDVISNTVEQLPSSQAMTIKNQESYKKNQLIIPEHFNALNQIVLNAKEPDLTEQLTQLSWFNHFKINSTPNKMRVDTLFETKSYEEKHHFLIKHMSKQFGLEELIPDRKFFPEWLFKDIAIRFDFFKNLYQFAAFTTSVDKFHQIRAEIINSENIQIATHSCIAMYRGLLQIKEVVHQNLQQCQQGIHKFFTRKARNFLNIINARLETIHFQLDLATVDYLQKITKNLQSGLLIPEPSIQEQLDNLQNYNFYKTEQVPLTLQKLGQMHSKLRVNAAMNAKVEKSSIVVLEKLLLSMQRPNANLTIHILTEFTKHYQKLTQTQLEGVELKKKLQKFLEKVCQHCEKLLFDNEASSQSLEGSIFQYQFLLKAFQMLQKQNSYQAHSTLNTIIQNTFLNYLKVVNNQNKLQKYTINELEQLLRAQSQILLTYANDDIKKIIKNCQTLFKQQRFLDLQNFTKKHLQQYSEQLNLQLFAKQLDSLENTIVKNLEKTPQTFKDISMKMFLKDVCQRMRKENINNVILLQNLTQSERVFLGFNLRKSFFSLPSNKILINTINDFFKITVVREQMHSCSNHKQCQELISTLKKNLGINPCEQLTKKEKTL